MLQASVVKVVRSGAICGKLIHRSLTLSSGLSMPQNVEIKARVEDLEELKRLAKKVSGDAGTLIEQEDTFFNSPQGYFKLRELKDAKSQLIYYERPTETGPKLSDYHVTVVQDPAELKFSLEKVCGIKGTVRKHRMLYMAGQTRIHCDRVDTLGDFMELEVMMKDGQSIEEGNAIAEDLMSKLNIHKDNLIVGAYMEHILKMKNGAGDAKAENGEAKENGEEANGEAKDNGEKTNGEAKDNGEETNGEAKAENGKEDKEMEATEAN